MSHAGRSAPGGCYRGGTLCERKPPTTRRSGCCRAAGGACVNQTRLPRLVVCWWFAGGWVLVGKSYRSVAHSTQQAPGAFLPDSRARQPHSNPQNGFAVRLLYTSCCEAACFRNVAPHNPQTIGVLSPDSRAYGSPRKPEKSLRVACGVAFAGCRFEPLTIQNNVLLFEILRVQT